MLRKALPSDISIIVTLIEHEAKQSKVLPRTPDEIRSVIDRFYVWEYQGNVVGCCALEIYSPKLAEIRSLVVSHGHRRQGIGQKLLEACVKEANEKNIYEVLAVTDKVPFFESAGFHICLNGQYAMFFKNTENK